MCTFINSGELLPSLGLKEAKSRMAPGTHTGYYLDLSLLNYGSRSQSHMTECGGCEKKKRQQQKVSEDAKTKNKSKVQCIMNPRGFWQGSPLSVPSTTAAMILNTQHACICTGHLSYLTTPANTAQIPGYVSVSLYLRRFLLCYKHNG